MAAVTDVQRLQARVEELERWVYGPGGSRGSRKVSDLRSSGPFLGQTRAVSWPGPRDGCHFSPVACSPAFEITKVRDLRSILDPRGPCPCRELRVIRPASNALSMNCD